MENMTRYDLESVASKVDGYYLPRPDEELSGRNTAAFDRAKAETAAALRRQISCIEALTFGEFLEVRRHGLTKP